jgi:hypothetical protein
MQTNAGKSGGTIQSLLIEHARLNKTPGPLARLLSPSTETGQATNVAMPGKINLSNSGSEPVDFIF